MIGLVAAAGAATTAGIPLDWVGAGIVAAITTLGVPKMLDKWQSSKADREAKEQEAAAARDTNAMTMLGMVLDKTVASIPERIVEMSGELKTLKGTVEDLIESNQRMHIETRKHASAMEDLLGLNNIDDDVDRSRLADYTSPVKDDQSGP